MRPREDRTPAFLRLAGHQELVALLRIPASALDMRAALYNPFAERGAGPVRLTAVAAAAARFRRHLPALLGGRFGDDMDFAHGYLSGRGAQAEVRGIGGYALDGEAFAAGSAGPIMLSSGIRLRVLRA
ncbi:MAG TPA: hypothetical protein VMH77_09020 [Steroidobacteraceae bacterium]|nr:hypothetical protein [Steroidobacteraceae bacterium]